MDLPAQKNLNDDLFADDSSKDFQILVQGQEILAHRCVLALKSPVLAALLRSDMVESRLGEMKIVDFEAEIVRAVIHYFYRGFLPSNLTIYNNSPKFFTNLVHFGHKYDIPDLIQIAMSKVWQYRMSFNTEDRKNLLSIVYKIDPEMNCGICDAVQGIFRTEGFKFDPAKYPDYLDNWSLGSELYADDSFKNFKIRFGTREFPVHKCIISMYCPALLQNMTHLPVGNFGYLNTDILEQVIGFFYKDQVSAEAQKDPALLVDFLNFGTKLKCQKIVNYSIGQLKEVNRANARRPNRIIIL